MLGASSIEEGLRASAREMVRYAIEHPGWTGVYVEFWTHASHRPELRRRVAEQHERLLDTVGALVEEWAGRWEVEFTLPPREVVRGTYALSRGMGLADRLRALAGEQLARDRWSRDRLLAYQGERLRALIAHAVAASPYYREVLGPDAADGEVPLAELPTLPKATLLDNFDRIVTDPRLRLADLEAHLSGPGAGQPFLGRYRLFSTAGTTGLRGLFVEDADEFAVWIGTCLRGLASWGLGPATRLAGIGSPSPLHISNQLYAVLLAGQPSTTPRLAVTTPLPEMVAALNAFQPEVLTAYPSVAATLAEEQLQGRLRIAPALVATSSEVLTVDMRRRIGAAWGWKGAADQPGQPRPAAAPLRADRLGHLGRRAEPAGAALCPHRRDPGPQRRRRHPAGGRRRPRRGASVPAAGAVLQPAGGPPVPGRPRPGRPARRGRAARLGPGRHPGPHPGRPGRRAPGRGRGPAPDRGHPVARA
jgi:hypothetical protein